MEFLKRFMENLPTDPADIWTDDEIILFKDGKLAEQFADMIESAFDDVDYINTGYYDPQEDKRDNMVDEYTGYYYVSWD